MPTALPKSDRLAHWTPQTGQDSGAALPCPLYTGHLLKLGSNDRWQSRLFTFDGSVLICLGKKPKAPVIMTYDPYVSSPFQSPSCHPRPLNPNTKWYIEIASITAIKLLPVTTKTRCFPYSDTSKQLSIQTKDGRNMTLRASKDIELERWYFTLSKIWELQQQLELPVVAAGEGGEEGEGAEGGSPCATKNLAAHQQSAQLFQRYLQKQYNHTPHKEGAESPLHEQQLHQQQQQHQPPTKLSPFHHLRPQQKKKPRESFLPYEIPPPPRVSAFLPQGFEWSLQEQGDEDDFPVGVVGYNIPNNFGHSAAAAAADDSRSASKGDQERGRNRRPMERQTSWSHQHPQQNPLIQGSASMNISASRHVSAALTIVAASEVLQPTSAEMYHQRFACPAPAAGSMEPGKAAIIDNWRRSLHLPLLVDDTTVSPPPHGDESVDVSVTQQQQHTRARTIAVDQDTADLADLEDEAATLNRLSLGLDMAACNNTESGGLHSATVVPSPIADLSHWANTPHDDYSYAKNNNLFAQQQHHQDDIIKGLAVLAANNNNNINKRASVVAKEEDELPLGLLQSNRHSRWLNTQLSSEDGASNAPKETERAPFTVHVPIRQIRRCPSIPPSSVVVINNINNINNGNNVLTKPKKYIPIDTTPYTTLSSSLPHHPPPRPPRPPSGGINSLAGPDDPLSNTNNNNTFSASLRPIYNISHNTTSSNSTTSPPIPPPANYKNMPRIDSRFQSQLLQSPI
ncbi:MAG: hypothetical protein J3R72DRAFT_509029 [Linnemannia gamsii]|nr:MAG: hypothetical protein J3R72DRAFT_509029 [Linnemannia gamsii]